MELKFKSKLTNIGNSSYLRIDKRQIELNNIENGDVLDVTITKEE